MASHDVGEDNPYKSMTYEGMSSIFAQDSPKISGFAKMGLLVRRGYRVILRYILGRFYG